MFARSSALPGFRPTLSVTLFWLSFIVLLPMINLVIRPWELGWHGLYQSVTEPRVLAAIRLSFVSAIIAAAVNTPLGLMIAWVLVRYRFVGRSVADAIIDMPLALPTAVAGIALTALFAPRGWIGALLIPMGIKVAYTPLGILVALIFVGLPFVVRTLEPVILNLPVEAEEAAATLGAHAWQTWLRITLPALAPALLSGFAAALARGIGEYGSVIFIAGNMPMVSEIAPLMIMIRLETDGLCRCSRDRSGHAAAVFRNPDLTQSATKISAARRWIDPDGRKKIKFAVRNSAAERGPAMAGGVDRIDADDHRLAAVATATHGLYAGFLARAGGRISGFARA